MIRARLAARTPNAKASESFLKAVTPDSLGLKGLEFGGKMRAGGFEIVLSFDGRIETFISTLDDLLACLQAADATLRKVSSRTGD